MTRLRLFTLTLSLLLVVGLAPVTAARNDAKETPFRFVIVGDTGTGDAPQLAVARQMTAAHDRTPFGHVLMVGDNIYGGKFSRIDAVFNLPYKPLLQRGVQFHVTLGNHDLRSAAEQTSFKPFNMGGRRNYSFKPAGDLVEFFTIDTSSILEGRLLDQLEWLGKALEESKATWKIAFLHHPPYSPGSRHGDDPLMIHRVVPILKKHGVRVVFSGHEHFFAKIATRDGIDYMISGSGGKIHRKAIDYAYPGLEAGNDVVHHFVSATLTDDELVWEAIGSDGATLARGRIPRKPQEKK